MDREKQVVGTSSTTTISNFRQHDDDVVVAGEEEENGDDGFSYMPHICHWARAPVCADVRIMLKNNVLPVKKRYF